MKNFIKRLFNLDRVEQLELENARLQEFWGLEAEKRSYEVRRLVEQNARLIKNEYENRKTWEGLGTFDDDRVYYVVTQGGYYQIKGWRINKNVMAGVTRRAVKNGFVVSSENEAKRLQEALKKLAW